MFAYCLNNPVVLSDESGAIAGWIGEQIGEFLYELFSGDDHPNNEAENLDNRIREKQLQSLKKGIKTFWDAYQHSIELEVQAQHEHDMMVIQTVEFLYDNPLIAIDAATTVVGTGLTYVGVAATVAGISIPIAGQIAMGIVGLSCGVWATCRIWEQIYDSLQ